jgi:hypothetical protein
LLIAQTLCLREAHNIRNEKEAEGQDAGHGLSDVCWLSKKPYMSSGCSDFDTDSEDELLLLNMARARCEAAELAAAPPEPPDAKSSSSLPEKLAARLDDVASAKEMLAANGVVVCERALPCDLLVDCCCAFQKNRMILDEQLKLRGVEEGSEFCFNEVCRRGANREDIRWGLSGGHFEHPLLHAEAPWLPIIEAALGSATELFRGVVDNRSGSDYQRWHHDGDGACVVGTLLTVFVPLVDVPREQGPTQFILESHKWSAQDVNHIDMGALPSLSPELSLGSVVIFDYKLMHRGTPNTSVGGPGRPVLYIVYAQPPHADTANFPEDCPLFAY